MTSSTSVEFCDTNVIVYAYDISAGPKRETARRLLVRLWQGDNGALSIQVLQETYVSLVRKLSPPVAPETARRIINNLVRWRVVEPDRYDVLAAIDTSLRWQISFWDAMLLLAARNAGAALLWSEDLNHGQSYDGVVVRNPFL